MGSIYRTPIRFREDTGWEFRCQSCADAGRQRFWPLGEEFWDYKRGMIHCRACWRSIDAAYAKARYDSTPSSLRAAKAERSRRYRQTNAEAQRVIERLRWQRVKSDPEKLEKARARGRLAQRRYRERRVA